MKRIVAMILALVLVFALVGCGKGKKREPIKLTLSTEDSEAILAAAGINLPDAATAAGANSTVKWFCWYDPFQNYDEGEIVNTGYWTFTEKYNSNIELIETDYFERYNDLANLILSSNSPDMFPAGTGATATYPISCLKGTFVPVDDYINYDDPLWAGMKDAANYYILGGKHFAMITDLTFRDVVSYNRRVMEEWGFDDPATLFANDEWTWAKFAEMCRDFSDGDENRYALDGYAYQGGIVQSTGQQVLQLDENGKFYSNIDSPEIERAQNLIYDLVKDDCCYHEGTNRWALRSKGGENFGAGIADGLCLFYIIETSFFTNTVEMITPLWGDVSQNEVMFCPLPRDENGDGKYYLNSAPKGYCLVSGGENHAGAALLASCERFKILDPTVVNIDKKQLKEVYLWNDEMLDMVDTCYEIAARDPIIILTGDLPSGLSSPLDAIDTGITRAANPTSWAQLKEQNREAIDYHIEELNAMIEEYNDGHLLEDE